MDLSQALLCLISFTSPEAAKEQTIQNPCTHLEQSADDQTSKVNLDFHQQKIGIDNLPMITTATEPIFME